MVEFETVIINEDTDDKKRRRLEGIRAVTGIDLVDASIVDDVAVHAAKEAVDTMLRIVNDAPPTFTNVVLGQSLLILMDALHTSFAQLIQENSREAAWRDLERMTGQSRDDIIKEFHLFEDAIKEFNITVEKRTIN